MAGRGFGAKDLITFHDFEKKHFNIPKTVDRILFINGESPENPIRVQLSEPLPVQELYLMAYEVTGVPSTSGVPNHSYMNMVLNGGPSHTLLIRNDGQNGIPLLLFQPITYHQYSPPMLLSTQRTNMQNFQIYFTNADGTPAQYDSVVMWFACKNVSPFDTPFVQN